MKPKTNNIGIEVKTPSEECNDKHCPFHSGFKVHGRILKGKVKKVSLGKTVTIEFLRLHFIPKYERYEKRLSKIKAHNPPCINAKVGDTVRIIETRPISKTKFFVVIEVIKWKD